MQEVADLHFLQVEENEKLKDFVKQVVTTCFQEEKIEANSFYLSITLTTPQEIHKLNKEFRKVDKETDVLSFPIFEKEEIEQIQKQKKVTPVKEALGDIVISLKRVEEQAKEYGHSFERELAYMVVHGFYHIMGYDHIQEKEKIQMRKKEETVLAKLKQTRE